MQPPIAVTPTAAQVKALRKKVQHHYGLGIMAAQDKMADACYYTPPTWRQWERGQRKMHPSTWALVQLRTNAHPHWRLVSRVT